MQLTPNVFVETGYRGDTVGYIKTSEGAVLVDTPWRPTDALAWRKRIEADMPIRYVINTHWHRDHTLCNVFFDAPVIGHEKTRAALLSADNKYMLALQAQIDPEGLKLLADYKAKPPAITFSDTLTLNLGGPTIQLIHLPGHSPDQSGVFIPEEKVLFAGDNVVCRMQAFFFDSDPFAWLASLERMSALPVEHVVPGHGPVCDRAYFEEQSSFIKEWIAAVKQGIESGWSKEEAMDRISFLDRYPMLSEDNRKMGPALQRENVARIYEVLQTRGG